MSQFLRPDGDIGQSGSWQRVPVDGTILWNTLDEATPDDADYVWHNNVTGTEYFEISLSDPAETPGAGTQTIRWRAERRAGARTVEVTCELRQGAVVKASQAQTLGAIQTYSFTNSAEITDWTDLRLRFTVTNVSGGGQPPDPAIYWAEFEVPDAPAADLNVNVSECEPGWNRKKRAN